MSEYQFVHFLAIDRPLNEKQLDFMQRQSTRAEISAWEFANEYHYGDFRGNALEMLRRGYDVHLHYANFGIRKLMFRLPGGLPCDKGTFKAFRPEYGVEWRHDKRGPGGVLEIEPQADAGNFDEDLFNVGEVLPKLAPVREMLMAGDLRPLYVAWLACVEGEKTREPPVPAGLGNLPKALQAMARFYELSEDLLAAVAERSPPAPKAEDSGTAVKKWIAGRSAQELRGTV